MNSATAASAEEARYPARLDAERQVVDGQRVALSFREATCLDHELVLPGGRGERPASPASLAGHGPTTHRPAG